MKAILYFLLLCCTSANAQSQTDIQRINDYIDSFNDDPYFGIAVQIKKGNEVVLERYDGAANWEHLTPIDSLTVFNIASIGKLFTATRILQLVQTGRLALHEPIAQYLPNFPNDNIKQVTTHQLLTHTSGLPLWPSSDFAMVPKFQYQSVTDYMPLLEAISIDTTKVDAFNYSNTGYVVLGLLIEQMDKVSYEYSVAEHVFAKAKMYNTENYDLMDVITKKATGYTRPNGKNDVWKTNEHLNMGGNPAGGAHSTVGDLQRFMASLRNYELLDEKHTKLMMTPHVIRADEHYGYGMAIRDKYNQTQIGHDGGFWGVRGEVFWFEKADWTVAILANSDQTNYIDISHCVATQLFGTKAQKSAWENTLTLINEVLAREPNTATIEALSTQDIDEMLLEIKAYYHLNFNNERNSLRLFELYASLFPESESAIKGLELARGRFGK